MAALVIFLGDRPDPSLVFLFVTMGLAGVVVLGILAVLDRWQ